MAVARKTTETSAPETTEPEPPQEQGGASATIADVERIVKEQFDNLLQHFKGSPSPETPEKVAEPAKRRTYRDEEENMESLVAEKVEELFARERETGSSNAKTPETTTAEKAEPERIPGQPKGRRVESIMGWK